MVVFARCVGFGVLMTLIVVASLVFFAPQFGWQVGTIKSGSMEPALEIGGVAVLQEVEAESIDVGDIIAYKPYGRHDKTVTHRVVEVVDEYDKTSFRTKGDANSEPDPYSIPAGAVDGVVRMHIPLVGQFVDFAQTRTGFLVLIAIPGFLIIGMELKNIVSSVGYMRKRDKTCNKTMDGTK
ncbi:MAG: signal peptidase I [Chloroflexota bacterium]|nr:signal peptidase I [Chloroflexota bacterium]